MSFMMHRDAFSILLLSGFSIQACYRRDINFHQSGIYHYKTRTEFATRSITYTNRIKQ